MRVFFDRPPLDEALPRLDAEHTAVGPDPEEWAGSAGAVVGGSVRYDAERLDRNPALRVLARTGIGIDNVDLGAATERGVIVCNTPDAPTTSTAEHTIALLMMAAKRLDLCRRWLRDGTGQYTERSRAVELRGRTLGLVGYGRIGRKVAAIADALGMRVVVHDPFADVDRPTAELDELLADSDVISLHLPATPVTRHLLDERRLGLVGPEAILVNCARGALVDHEALVAALDAGRVAVAALDVTDPEPLPPGHPLLERDDVIVTPHVASATFAGRLRMQVEAIAAVNDVLAGRTPRDVCNPSALTPGAHR